MKKIVKAPRNEDRISFDDRVDFVNPHGEVAIEIPDEEGQKTDVLVMSRVSNILMILKSSRKAKYCIKCSAVSDPIEAAKVIQGTTKQKLSDRHDGNVVCLKDTDKAILLKKSNILGYVGILVPFNEGNKKDSELIDIVSNLERSYMRFIKVQGLASKHLVQDYIKKCAELEKQFNRAKVKSCKDDVKIKNLTAKLTTVGTPKIGIFWYTDDYVLLYPAMVEINDSFNGHPCTWEELRRKNILDKIYKELDWKSLPRGRVECDPEYGLEGEIKRWIFRVYSGEPCKNGVCENKSFVFMVVNGYHLGSCNVVWLYNHHYDRSKDMDSCECDPDDDDYQALVMNMSFNVNYSALNTP
jgi:hypothetical protein